MARQKKPVHRVQMTEGKRNIIRQLLEEYDIENAEDLQDALKDLLGGTIKEMMEAEMDNHLGSDEQKALAALDTVTEKWAPKYPNSMKRWRDNWDAISPIFKFSYSRSG